jgi:parvulin-like peptidyl-prolyl isomerase
MEPGDITQVLRSGRGYQILKLETKTEAITMPFEEAREQISNRVFTDKRRQEFEKFMERLRSEAIIDWKSPELKEAYERGLEQLRTAGRRSSD